MFNPYFHDPSRMLQQSSSSGSQNPLEGILNRIRRMDSDDLLLLLLIVILVKDGCREDVWPLVAALIYCVI